VQKRFKVEPELWFNLDHFHLYSTPTLENEQLVLLD